jgi:serine/alanine adding enzyme
MSYTLISDFDKIDKSQWIGFISSHPDGNIFQTPEMFEVYRNSLKHEPVILALYENNEIQAIVLALIQKEYNGIIGRFTSRSTIYGGPLFRSNNPAIITALLEGYLKLVQSRVIFSEIRNFSVHDEETKKLFTRYGFTFENHLNILLDLKVGVDELWKGVASSRKKGIRKAGNQGFGVRVTNTLDSVEEFYDLLVELHKKIKVPFSDISLYRNFNKFLKGHMLWFILEYEGKPSYILCAFQYNKVLYTYSSGSRQDQDFLRMKPGDYFFWEVIKWAAENGIEVFDWMGAGKPDKEYGVRKFKLEYGGETINLGRYMKIHNQLLFTCGKYGLQMWKKFLAPR